MKEKKGVTLLALTIALIIMILLAGITVSLFGGNGTIKNTENALEQSKIESMRAEIELAIAKKIVIEDNDVTIEQIIEELENVGIINEGEGNPDNGQIKTQPDGYIYEIKEKSDGKWEVKYIGQGEIDKSAITISVTGNTTKPTTKVTLKIKGSSLAGITKYTPGTGTEKTYANGTTKIEETCEITANGTYTFAIENIKGKTVSKTITINNIIDGEIQISASPATITSSNVTVTVIWPSGTSTATKQISTNGGTSWGTYTGNTSTVTVSSNCTVKARIISGTEEIKTATITINNIDKTAPTAPIITGGSTEYATSRTISISKEPEETGSGVAYYEYYLNSSSTEPATATTATGKLGETSETKSKTFNENYAGYYVYYRAIDRAGNIGAWSTAQRLYIDVNTPTVTAKQTSVTITEGDSNSISSYFTVAQNGNAGISKTEYIDTSKSNAVVTNTNTLAVGTHVIKCTATKTTGTTANATMTIVVSKKTIASITTTDHITISDLTDDIGNKVVIPGGFKISSDSGKTVEEGIVIEDSDGNQFVWIPVGNVKKKNGSTVTITLGRYTFDESTGKPNLQQNADNYTDEVLIGGYSELLVNKDGNIAAKNLGDFINKTKTNGGYYIARYEASNNNGKAESKKGATVWNGVYQDSSSSNSRNMYVSGTDSEENYITSDLVNSYAWDTALVYIYNCSNYPTYPIEKDNNTVLYKAGARGDEVCKINDMKGNEWEFTTEHSNFTWSTSRMDFIRPSCLRGSQYTVKAGTMWAASFRHYSGDQAQYRGAFRVILYFK